MTHHLNIACSSEQITPVVADHTVQYLSHVLGSPGGHPCSPETPLDSLANTPPPATTPHIFLRNTFLYSLQKSEMWLTFILRRFESAPGQVNI
jgi:hypothetical protein